MTFETEMEKFSNEPIALCTIELDSGDQHIAKIDVAESSNFYDGYVKSFGTVSRTVAGTNSNFKTSDLSITCINVDQHFSQTYNYKTLLNRTVSISVGTVDLAIGDFKQIYKGVIQKFEYGTETFKITVTDATDRYISTKDYSANISTDDFGNADESAIGKKLPILYGEGTGIAFDAPCLGYLVSDASNSYVFAGHASKAINNVYQRETDGDMAEVVPGASLSLYPARAKTSETIDNAAAVDKGSGLVGIPITAHGFNDAGKLVFFDGTTNYDGTHIIQSQTADEITISVPYVAETFGGAETVVWYVTMCVFAADKSDYQIIANIDGLETVGDGSGATITNPTTQMEHFLDTWLSLPSELKDSTGFTAAETIATNRSYANAGMILNSKEAKKVLQEMALCSNALIFHNTDGEISVEIFDVVNFALGGITPTPYTDQNEILEKSFKLKPQLNNLANRVIVNYKWDQGLGEYKKQAVYDSADAQSAANKIYSKVLNFPFINVDAMAADVGQRFLKQYRYPPMEVTFKTSLTGLNNDLVDMIEVTHFAGIDTGGYNDKLFKIEKINPDLNKMTVSISAIDASGLLTSVFILGDNTAIGGSWTDGDADQDYGYLCSNITNQFSNGDPGKRLY